MSLGFNPDGLGTQTEIVQINGQFFERKTNILSGTVEDTPININLSPTRDPREALNIQKNNEFIEQAKKAAMYVPIGGGLGVAGVKAAPKIPGMLKGVRDFFVKRKDLQVPPKRVLDKGTVTQIPGAVLPGAGGFGLTTPGAVVAGGVGTTGAMVGLDQLVAGETPDMRPIKDIDMTVLESGADSSKIDETEESLKTKEKDETDTGDVDNIGDQDGDDGASQEAEVRTTADLGVPRFVDPSRMLDFARNVSLGLLQEGQLGGGGLGAGLAIGTQIAVTERQKKDLLAAQQKREEELLQKELDAKIEIEKLKGAQDLKEYQDSLIKLNEQSSEIEGLDTTAGLFAEAQNLLRSGDATGFFPLIGSVSAKVQRFFGQNPELTTREQAVIILEAIANGNVQEITGEPEGARISDADRQVARELVGNLKDPLVDAESALEKIDIQLNDIATRRSKSVDAFDILAIGLPYEDVMRYSPKTTPLPGMAASAQTIPLAGPR
tara:strand:+ start:149 stop:1630 length:1482 start_codon:yes stop_codon:yes gene_type:complete